MDSVLIEPVANQSNITLIGSNAAASPIADLTTKLQERSLDIPPGQAGADGTREDQLEGALALPLHGNTVLGSGTTGGSGSIGFKPPVQSCRLRPPQSKAWPVAAGASKQRSRSTHHSGAGPRATHRAPNASPAREPRIETGPLFGPICRFSVAILVGLQTKPCCGPGLFMPNLRKSAYEPEEAWPTVNNSLH